MAEEKGIAGQNPFWPLQSMTSTEPMSFAKEKEFIHKVAQCGGETKVSY